MSFKKVKIFHTWINYSENKYFEGLKSLWKLPKIITKSKLRWKSKRFNASQKVNHDATHWRLNCAIYIRKFVDQKYRHFSAFINPKKTLKIRISIAMKSIFINFQFFTLIQFNEKHFRSQHWHCSRFSRHHMAYDCKLARWWFSLSINQVSPVLDDIRIKLYPCGAQHR